MSRKNIFRTILIACLTVVENFNGTINGAALNGTFTGRGHPVLYKNGTVFVNNIDSYGATNDGFPFYVSEIGIGPVQKQISRLVSSLLASEVLVTDNWQEFTIGGPYEYLNEAFLLGVINVFSEEFIVVEVYKVS